MNNLKEVLRSTQYEAFSHLHGLSRYITVEITVRAWFRRLWTRRTQNEQDLALAAPCLVGGVYHSWVVWTWAAQASSWVSSRSRYDDPPSAYLGVSLWLSNNRGWAWRYHDTRKINYQLYENWQGWNFTFDPLPVSAGSLVNLKLLFPTSASAYRGDANICAWA